MAGAGAAAKRSQLLDAALEQMAKAGLESVTIPTLASQVGDDSDAISRIFRDGQNLRDAMARRLLADVRHHLGPEQGWQDMLRARTRNMRRVLLAHRDGARLAAGAQRASPDADAAGRELLGQLMRDGFTADRAREAILMIDRFAIGWCLDEASMMARGAANPRPSRDTEFEFALEVLIAGLAAVAQQVPQSALRTRRRTVTMGIWALLRYARQSGESAYGSSNDLTELERRLLVELRRGIVSRSAEMIASSGLDKAQVSRAVRRLDEAELLYRDGARGPLGLTAEGERIADRFIEIGDDRNDEIIAGIDFDDLADFAALVAQMTASAIKLLEQEQSWEASRSHVPLTPIAAVRSRNNQILVVPPLATLYSYMQRSGALMIRRVADMSNFAWLVLSTVAEMGPMTPAALIEMVERDHSQARRTLRHLIELGLVTQFAIPGQRGRMLHPTEKGREAARRLEDEGWSRDTLLYGDIPPDRLERFLTLLDKLTGNAMVQVERCGLGVDV